MRPVWKTQILLGYCQQSKERKINLSLFLIQEQRTEGYVHREARHFKTQKSTSESKPLEVIQHLAVSRSPVDHVEMTGAWQDPRLPAASPGVPESEPAPGFPEHPLHRLPRRPEIRGKTWNLGSCGESSGEVPSLEMATHRREIIVS